MSTDKKSSVRLNISRVFLVFGLLVGCLSLSETIRHVGSPDFLLISGTEELPTHAWYHVFRESIGDIMAILILLVIFFGKSVVRNKSTWYISLFIMFGYYAPFWIGTPFLPELAAPHLIAELVHIVMAAFPITALFLSRNDFYNKKESIEAQKHIQSEAQETVAQTQTV